MSKAYFEGVLQIAEAEHLLRIRVPDFQAKAPQDFQWAKGSGFGVLQFGNGAFGFGETIEGNASVEMVDVVIADVGGEPGHDGIDLHEAG